MPETPPPCPRCGSADVTVQPQYSDLEIHGPEKPIALTEASILAHLIGLVGALLLGIGGIAHGLLQRWGWCKSVPRKPMVRFCHDCGWNEPAA